MVECEVLESVSPGLPLHEMRSPTALCNAMKVKLVR